LAIQKSAISEGAIVLVDEIEHGLEPHRIIGAIAQLKADQEASVAAARPVGQVLMTTHSDVAVGETGPERLRVVQMTRPGRQAAVLAPTAPDPIRALLRFTPRALFARRVLVTEGNTEIGLLLGIREHWPARHAGKPIEQLGVAIADGNGAQAPAMALALHELGFQTAIFRDSDTTLSPAEQASLAAAGIQIFEYGGDLNTEQAIFGAASDDLVQELLNFAREERGNDAIDNNIDIKIPDLTLAVIRETFSAWELFSELDGPQLREAIAEVAVRKKWFKDQRIGRGLSPMVWRIAEAAPGSLLATALRQAEAWLYA
jgi:predicted ATP-dependent endonuclease of OLD family